MRSWLVVVGLCVAGLVVVAPAPSQVATAGPTPLVVYDAIDTPQPANVPSVGFEATQTSAFGDLVQLAAGPRRLQTVTVLMSSWGCESGGWNTGDCTTTPGATFNHPLTLTLYQSDPSSATGVGAQILTSTQTFGLPYRPSQDPTCVGADAGRWKSAGTCYNGFATPVTFNFPTAPTVPTALIWTLSYNTTHSGPAPIGESAPCYTESGGCGYDSLNVGLSGQTSPAVGVDVDPDGVVQNSATGGNYCTNPPPAGASVLQVDTGPACWTGYRPMARISVVTECTTTCYVDAATGNDLNGGTSATDAKKTIQAGVTAVNTGGTVIVAGGTYVEDVNIPKGLTLQGAGIDTSIVSGVAGGDAATIRVAAANVVITGFTITREGNNTTDWNNNLNTAGVAVQSQGNTARISQNKFSGNRTAIDINNSDGNTIADNVIQNNRTGIIFRERTDNTTVTGNVIADNWTLGVLFLDGSGNGSGTQSALNSIFADNSISGNWYGGVVDRQAGGSIPAPGTNLKNFSGNWLGNVNPVVTVAAPTEPPYATQIPVAFGGSAVNPGGAPDILGAASANIDFTPFLASGTDTAPATIGFQGSHATLVVTAAGAQTGSATRIQEGITAVDPAGSVQVRAGDYPMGVAATITKPLSLVGPNVGVSPNSAGSPLTANPARVAEATITPIANVQALQVGSPSVTIDGLRFTDSATAGGSNVAIIGAGGNFGGNANSLIVRNNVFNAITRTALYTNGPTTMTGVTVANNRVANPTRANGCGTPPAVANSACGYQLFNLWEADKATFDSNVIYAPAANGDRMRVLQVNFPNATSAQTDSPADNVVISRNTIRNACVYTCFSIAKGVDNLSITRNDVAVDAGNIVQLRPEWITGRVQIDHNTFVASNGAAVIADPVTGTTLTGVNVTRNAITAGGVANQRAETIAATCNWWGQSTGPLAAQNSGPVNASDPLATTDLDGACPGVPDFNPAPPTRVFDTRPGTGPNRRDVAKVKLGTTPLAVQLTDLPGLVPATGVGAVSLNVTSTRSDANGFITVSPCGVQNGVSNVNFQARRDRANAVITQVSATGTVCFTSSVPTDIVVDVNGWFKAPPGFHPVDPTRVFDTRAATPQALRTVPKRPVAPGTTLVVQVTDLPGLVPATGVGAVSINLTSTQSTADGYVTVSACGVQNGVSNLNFQAGDDAANLVVTPVSAAGTICFTTSAPTDLIVDVNGWFKAPSGYTAVNPARVADTRQGSPPALLTVPKVPVGPGSTLVVKLLDLQGGLVPASGVGAVSINVTSTRAAADGFLTVQPCGVQNVVSSVNFQAGRDRANAVLTPVSAAGTACITASAPTDVVIDVNGWFSNTATS